MSPLISIVVPTRDRPQYLEAVLSSIARQRFGDFEVIVCDNPVNRPVSDVVAKVGDSRFRYFRADGDLNIPDNWNYGCNQANGEYIMVLTDKFALRYDTLARFEAVRHNMPAQIYNWYQDSFYLTADQELVSGIYHQRLPARNGPIYYDLNLLLRKRLACDCLRGTDGAMYCLGKMLCFGVYHRTLVGAIINATGKVFHPLAPEYSTMTAACILGERAVDLGFSGTVGITPSIPISTGHLMETQPDFARRFFESMVDFDDLLNRLPVPGLFQSGHNIVAHTMLTMCDMLSLPTAGLFVRKNLLELCRRDIERICWPTSAARSKAAWYLQEAGGSMAPNGELHPFPFPSALLDRWKGKESYVQFNTTPQSLESVLEALDQLPC